MAWNKLYFRTMTALALAGAALVVGCNVGKTDTVAAGGTGTTTSAPTTATSNTGTYSGGFDSPVKLLCIDPPGLDPAGHGECGQRYTLAGSISFTVQGDTITGGDTSFYGYSASLNGPSKIDANGNFNYSMGFANGSGKVVNGVMTGIVWEGPFEWKYGEFQFNKQ